MTPEEFASYADFFSEAAMLLRDDGTILAANRHVRALGLDPNKLAGRQLSEIAANSSLEISSYLRDCARNRQLVLGSLTLRTETGDELVCRCDGARFHGDESAHELLIKFVPRSQSTAQFSGLNQKITELTEEIRRRRQLQNELFVQQQSLREAERRLKAVFNQQFQFMAILAPDGTVLEANDSCFRATGIQRQQVLRQFLWETPFWNRLPAVQQKWKNHVAEVAAGGGPLTWEAEYTLADGSIRHASIAVTGLRSESGNVTSIVVEGHDDTDRKRGEAVLAGQKHVLELMVHGAPLPHVLDALCEIIEQQSSQKSFATVLLLDADGQHLRSVAGRRVAAEYAQAVDGVAIGPSVGSCGTAAYRREPVIVSDIATDPLWADFRQLALSHGLQACWSIPFFSSQGNVLGTFAVYYPAPGMPQTDELQLADILSRTAGIAVERRRDEESLRDADRRKDEFLATLAHELRNPLAPLRNGLHVLQLAGSDEQTAAEARGMMERQLEQMVRLVDDLLDVSRISRNKLELRKQRVELRDAIHSAVETSRPLIEESRHDLSVTIPPEPIFLDADLTRLSQVFLNLLNNSAKYTEPGGRISLLAERVDGDVVIKVKDNGIGIPAEALPHLFQMFSQVDANMCRAQGGLGIGLTLVRRLVELHGGSVSAHSEGPGRGTEFVVRLPCLHDQLDYTAEDEPPVAVHANTVQRRVLIVDDNRDSARSLDIMLRLMGNETRVAFDGMQAVTEADQFRPDIILLDIGLPKLNGYDACRQIRGQAWAQQTFIVAVTGWGQQEDRRRSREAGFDHHLVKPLDRSALDAVLNLAVS